MTSQIRQLLYLRILALLFIEQPMLNLREVEHHQVWLPRGENAGTMCKLYNMKACMFM